MKSKHLLLTLLLALLVPWAANAQNRTTVTIGTGTSTQRYPLPGYYGYQYDVYLYTPSAAPELGVDSDISSIAFYVSTNNTSGESTMKIWVKDVAANYALNSSTTFNTYTDDAALVYENEDLTTSTGWNTFDFSSTFSHQAGMALLVAVRGEGCGTSACARQCTYTSATNTTWYKHQDNSDPGMSTTGGVGSSRANIQLELTYTGAVCFTPSGLTASNVTDNAATLSWTESGSSTAWTLEYGTASDYAGATTVNVSGTPTTSLSGLTALTTYYVRVKADCGSDWLEGSFSTTARAEEVGDAWSDDFEGESCGWELINGTQTNKWFWGTAASNGGTHGLYVSNDNGTTNAYSTGSTTTVFATKLLNFTEGKYEFSYDWKANGESTYDYLRVALVPASVTLTAGTIPSGFSYSALPTGWIALDGGSKLNLATAWQNKSLAINVPAGNYYLVMAWRNDSGGGSQPPAAVDNVNISKIACDYDVEGLAVSNITTTTADIAWTNSEAGEWQVAIKEGTDEWETLPTTFTTNGGTLTGLTAATNYQVKVRAYCDADHQGSWCETISFASACEVIPALGFTEDFDDITLPSTYTPSSRTLPICWSYINECTYSSYMYYPTVYYYSYTDYSHSSPNSLRFYSSYSSYSDYDPQPQYAILPEMTGLAGLQVTLMAKGYSANSTFKIGTMSDPTDATTFTMIAEQTLTTSYPEEPFEYIIPATCTDNYLAIMIDAADASRSTNAVYIDDIEINEAPTCFKPTELAVTANSITSDGAIITWTAGGSETQWQIEFATDANFTNPLYETAEGEPTYTFHGLDESTTYYVHVQAVCGGSNGSSEYSLPVSFTTLQTAVNLPYANDFENENGWLFVNGNLTNAWAYGEATNNGGTHALYVSNDGGTTNAYTNNSAAMVYATKLFNFEAGTYVFSYDWRANGEAGSYGSVYDYMRVALVPSTVQLTASTSAPTVPSGSFYNNLPEGWIALDGGSELQGKTEWQSFTSNEIEITTAGTYMMVFAWRDDTSSGSNPPAAIDNVSIERITCTTPTNLAVPASGITAHSAQVSWTETGEATAWQIELIKNNSDTTYIPVAETQLVGGVYTIASLTSETLYSVRVRANCGDGYSSWSEEIIFETVADCQMSDGLAAANITSRSAVISWNGYGQDYFNLRYGTDGETWTTESKVANPYTLNQLEPATTYYVQVQPTCAGEEVWSAEYSFTTECEAMTITATEPFTEGFEDITGTHIYSETNGIVPTCWESYSEGSVYPHITNSGSYYYVHEGTGTMYFKGEASTNSYLALPLFTNDLSTLMVSFWMQTENASNGTLSLGYITDEDVDYNSYQVIKTYNNATSMVQRQTVLGYSNIPSNATRLVFRWQYTGTSWYGVCIDDVRVAVTETLTKEITGVGADNWNGENGGYYLIASPVVNELNPVDVGMIDAEGDYDLYYFNQAQELEWINYKDATFNLANGKGYLYANKADVTLTFIGEPVDGNEKTIYLDYTEGTEFAGLNLVGNPFTQNAYINKDFYVLNDTRNEVIAASEVEQSSIAPMEGVFVYAEGENDSVTINYMRSYGNSGSLALNLSQGRGIVDRAVVKFGQGSLPKFQLNPNHTKVYIPQGGKDYAVVSAEAMGEMPVNFKAEKNGTYSLSFTSQEVSFSYLHLIDNMTGNDVNLLETPSYTFNASTTDYASRFRLVFATGNSMDGENFGFVNAAGNLCIFGIEGDATVQVVDMMGRVLSSETFSGSYEKSINAAPGVYMIRLINGDDVRVQKIVVR